jgi:type II secretory pathway component GspD/PulD (secretin)
MITKGFILLWMALALLRLSVAAQTNTTGASKAVADATTNQAPQEASAPLQQPSPPMVIEAPAQPSDPASGELSKKEGDLASAPTISTNAPANAAVNLAIPASQAAGTNGPPQNIGEAVGQPNEGDDVLPSIRLNAKLMTVVKGLAELAKINYMLDPKISTGIGPDGKPVPEPDVQLMFANVTPRQVLYTVLETYNYTLVPTKHNSFLIKMKDPAVLEPLTNRVIQLAYSHPTNMVSILKVAFPSTTRMQAIADQRTSQLVIMATEKDMDDIVNLVTKLDTPTRQVLIEARILETSQNPQSIKGIDWSGTLQAQRVSFGNGLTSGQTTTTSPGTSSSDSTPGGRALSSTPGASTASSFTTTVGAGGNSAAGGLSMNTSQGFNPTTAFLNADGVSAVLSFLNSDVDTEVLATPRAVTLDNETAILSVSRAYPIFKITPGSASVAGGSEVTYTNMGTTLEVTPRISGKSDIALRVMPEVSNIDGKDTQTVNGQQNVANIYAIRRIQANVIIPSGHTLVMGGLISDSTTKSHKKVPLLGDLPGIGMAFRQDSKSRNKQNLLIFVTPTIISESDFQSLPSSQFLKAVPKESGTVTESAWDSGKPYDWKKKKPKIDSKDKKAKTGIKDAQESGAE